MARVLTHAGLTCIIATMDKVEKELGVVALVILGIWCFACAMGWVEYHG